MNIQENIDIKDYSTLKIGGQFRYFATINSLEELNYFYAIVQKESKYKNIPVFILGGGSNIVFSDGILNLFALKMEIKGFDIISETEEGIDIRIGAGENWDEIVEKTVNMNLSGIESLSAIPGTVGAGPVQNIGAYGSEVKDTIIEVEVYDPENDIYKKISSIDCKFGYRDSIFKNEAKGKYIITAVVYRLNKNLENNSTALSYPGVKKYFEENNNKNPTLKEIRTSVINIRNEKLPNPKHIPNVGSFFKNPIIQNEIADKIKVEFPEANFYPVGNSHTKIPAGWLIEKAGLKGKSFGNISIYDKNALILINNGNATMEDVVFAKNEIIKSIEEKFGISLEQEPENI